MEQSLEKQLLKKELRYYDDHDMSVEDKLLQDIRNSLPASEYRSYLVDNKKDKK